MRKSQLFAGLALAAVALFAATPAGLTVTCLDGVTAGGNCAVGRVTLSSPQYQGTVHVTVIRDSNYTTYDDFDYETGGGGVNFTETLIPGGSYTVKLSQSGIDYTQTVITGM